MSDPDEDLSAEDKASDTPPVPPAHEGSEPNLPPSVTHLTYEGRDIYLIGTAHVSQRSVEEVEEVIRALKPDTVCVELDKTRYETLTDATQWQKLDIFQVIKQKKVLFLLSSLVLSAYQRKMGEALGVSPGAELLTGVRVAKEEGAEVVLADRDVQATLKRTWGNLSLWNKGRVLSGLTAGFFASEQITPEDIEELKDKDNISDMMEQFAKAFPKVKEPLIDERDAYLMSMIQEAPGQTVVGVVGAGHVKGMVQRLGDTVDREALCVIPKPSLAYTVFKWAIPIAVIGIFINAFIEQSQEDLQQMLVAWVLPNMIFAAIGALLAGAKPLTTLVAAVGSPITSLNPALPLGVVTGTLEAWLRKPTVADCERIPEASKTVKGIYKNPFTRVLVVSVLTLAGSAIGGIIGVGWLISLAGDMTAIVAVAGIAILVLLSWAFQRFRGDGD
ncbi:MAG: TraB/GumN family protein [Myxococcota bacterium]